jgi:hypothetical protein
VLVERIVAELDRSIESWRVQYIRVGRLRGWWRPGGNPRAAAPGAFALRQPLWDGPNTHTGGGPITPKTNTITIL